MSLSAADKAMHARNDSEHVCMHDVGHMGSHVPDILVNFEVWPVLGSMHGSAGRPASDK